MMRNTPLTRRESRNSFAPGKVILSGEYAVIYGFAGIAVPSSTGIEVVFEEDPACDQIEIRWDGTHDGERWLLYAEKIIELCQQEQTKLRGRLVIHSSLNLGKGMGSSTALVIAITRALLGENAREEAHIIEDSLNKGHSGIDFITIWENTPVLFRKGDTPKHIDLPPSLLQGALLIDTGLPNESTTELVAWMRSRKADIEDLLKIIGNCTDRIVQGESLNLVMHDHSKAQVALGVVPENVQELIAAIEQIGGAAKVIGAGSRIGGAGMVLALGNQDEIRKIANARSMPTISL